MPLVLPPAARAASSCGPSLGYTICLSAPDVLTGHQMVTFTVAPTRVLLLVTWDPDSGPPVHLLTDAKASRPSGDHSFVWPTEKYLDGSGLLEAQVVGGAIVSIPVTLSNGNTTGIQPSPNDWANPLPWAGTTDPTIAAVGDGASDEPKSHQVEGLVEAASPPLFLYLGDIYEEGTYTEDLNHYGLSALDSSSPTLWGTLADVTQPTLGDHENQPAWSDYWHQRPHYTSFAWAGVLFIDLNSNHSLRAGDPQHEYVRGLLQANTLPCVVAYWHVPVASVTGSTNNKVLPMWGLLANNGGDLVLNGHFHYLAEYRPMNASAEVSGGHMVDLIGAAGGHGVSGKTVTDPRLAWQVPKTPGAIFVTLNGAGAGATTSLSWAFENTAGDVIRSGSVSC